MSNEALFTIALADLNNIHGGYEVDGEGSLTLPGGSGTLKGKYKTTPYDTCNDGIRSSASEKYPDNRWFWQRWLGYDDPNAGKRADYYRDNIGTCTPVAK